MYTNLIRKKDNFMTNENLVNVFIERELIGEIRSFYAIIETNETSDEQMKRKAASVRI